MSTSLLLDNLIAWSAQIAILTGIAAFASMILRDARARLPFWQGIFALALLLPAVEPWIQTKLDLTGVVSAVTSTMTPVPAPDSVRAFHWRREYLLWIIAAGAALRLLWIFVGLARLRRHRLDAHMLTSPPVPFSNPRVRWFVSTTVSGPVTFGFIHPSILLPEHVASLPAPLREVIAHHELIHVRRGDWLFVLAEETARALFWFHPAIWFALSRIQLAREQVVDAEVVELTSDRDRYLDALVAAASRTSIPDLAPAPLFLKKRQLAVRVSAILKETRMSKPRLIASFTTVASAVLLAARAAVWFFPLQAPAQTVAQGRLGAVPADAPGVTVSAGGKLLHRSPVFYPSNVTTAGTVTLEATLNSKGEVIDAHVIGGPDELRRVALASVLGWHYDPATGSKVQIAISFTAPPAAAPATSSVASPSISDVSSNLKIRSVMVRGVPEELNDRVRAVLPHTEDAFTSDTMPRLIASLKEIDEHLGAVATKVPPSSMSIVVTLQNSSGAGTLGVLIEGGLQTSAQVLSSTSGFIRVGANVQQANLIRKVTPEYPALAKQARIQGIVQFDVIIGKNGSVQNLQLISGHPLLVPAAQDAVQQWLYKPTLLNGEPVEVKTQIEVNFTLSQ